MITLHRSGVPASIHLVCDPSSSDTCSPQETSATVMCPIGDNLPIRADSPHEPDPNQSACEPEDGAEEAECLTGLPPVAFASVDDTSPMKDTPTGIRPNVVDKQAKDSEPRD